MEPERWIVLKHNRRHETRRSHVGTTAQVQDLPSPGPADDSGAGPSPLRGLSVTHSDATDHGAEKGCTPPRAGGAWRPVVRDRWLVEMG